MSRDWIHTEKSSVERVNTSMKYLNRCTTRLSAYQMPTYFMRKVDMTMETSLYRFEPMASVEQPYFPRNLHTDIFALIINKSEVDRSDLAFDPRSFVIHLLSALYSRFIARGRRSTCNPNCYFSIKQLCSVRMSYS